MAGELGEGGEPCPSCGSPCPAEATVCPLCGAPLPSPIDSLVAGLDDLESHADEALVEELESLGQVAEADSEAPALSPGAIGAVEVAAVAARPAEDGADLSAFVRKVEQSVARRSAPPSALPGPSPVASAALGAAAILYAAGVFLIQFSLPVALSTLLLAIGLTVAGLSFRGTPAAPQ